MVRVKCYSNKVSYYAVTSSGSGMSLMVIVRKSVFIPAYLSKSIKQYGLYNHLLRLFQALGPVSKEDPSCSTSLSYPHAKFYAARPVSIVGCYFRSRSPE